MKNVEGRKEEKGEEIKGKAIRPFGAEEEWREVPASEIEDSAVLENCTSESKQKREKSIENKR